ncbi:MAG: ExbD/TolR family protein [Pirellulaceae bacterium]
MKLSSRKLQRESPIELCLTAMIDVVFLLLIYFLTTSGFVKTERELDSGIQANRSSAGTAQNDLEIAIVDVIKADTGFVYRIGSRDMKTQPELLRVLQQFGNRAAGAFVRVADDVPFDMAAAAIQACKSARFVTVTYVPMESDR